MKKIKLYYQLENGIEVCETLKGEEMLASRIADLKNNNNGGYRVIYGSKEK